MTGLGRIALVSLDPWDQVWRRNQHLATSLLQQGLVQELLYVEPPGRGLGRVVLTPSGHGPELLNGPRALPRSLGGDIVLAHLLQPGIASADVLWVNDPVLGVHCLRQGQPVVYDVTDDWRDSQMPARARRRLVAAEDRLAGRAMTVVCSEVLRQRWEQRYGVRATLVHNGFDASAWQGQPEVLDGPGPHVGYIGSLQAERLDVPLVLALADEPGLGTVHLVGPDYLDPGSRQRLAEHPKVRRWGAIGHERVAGVTKAMDLLLCPHLVNDFTLSLDAIKAYEYLASGRPAVATPTSGFQRLPAGNVHVVTRDEFRAAVRELLAAPRSPDRPVVTGTWDERAHEFAAALSTARRSATTVARP